MSILRNIEQDLLRFRTRVFVAAVLVALGLVLLASRALYLQVVRYQSLAAQAEGNRTAIEPIAPRRGDILDRNGVVLARNHAAFSLEVIRSEVPDLEQTLAALSKVVELSERDLKRFERRGRDARKRDPILLRNDLTPEELARFAAQQYHFSGVRVRTRLVREYPMGAVAGHTLGYIGRISLRDREAMRDWPDEDQANYRGTEDIGKRGLELSYERELHGSSGFLRMEASAGGHTVRELARVPPLSGSQLKLTLDIKLQQLVESLFGDRRGALVALQPQTGEVLAMASMPSFDPNLFIDGIDVASWKSLNESIDRPLLNRALNGTYPPGSTYKPFMALLALHTGKRTAQTVIQDPGYWMLGNHKFRSHGDEVLGAVNMSKSIVMSSNVYYYSLAYELGVDTIHDFMAPFSFGQLTGIDLIGESTGLLPSKAWKAQAFKKPSQGVWVPGDTVSLGIGQGFNSFTILQMATATSAIANGGYRITPHLVQADGDQQPNQTHGSSLGIQPKDLKVVIDAMTEVTHTGTSRGAFAGAPYTSAGKTGTAQAVTIGQEDKYNARKLAERKRDHSLYIAFAPADHPQIALAAIVENAGFGSTSAAPIARRVFDYWLQGQYPSEADIKAVAQGTALTPVGTPRAVTEVGLTPRLANPDDAL